MGDVKCLVLPFETVSFARAFHGTIAKCLLFGPHAIRIYDDKALRLQKDTAPQFSIMRSFGFFVALATVADAASSARWCNEHLCLDALAVSGELAFAVNAKTQVGYIAIGTGSVMDGSKMWILYPGDDGCVLSERDGVSLPTHRVTFNSHTSPLKHGYKPPVITQQPISHILPHTGKTSNLACKFNMPTAQLLFFSPRDPEQTTEPMPMIWAYSSEVPVSENGSAAGAKIKRHDAFGTFDLLFAVMPTTPLPSTTLNATAPSASTTASANIDPSASSIQADENTTTRKQVMMAHAICMVRLFIRKQPRAS